MKLRLGAAPLLGAGPRETDETWAEEGATDDARTGAAGAGAGTETWAPQVELLSTWTGVGPLKVFMAMASRSSWSRDLKGCGVSAFLPALFFLVTTLILPTFL